MAKVEAMKPKKMPHTIRLYAEDIKGISGLTVDGKVTIMLTGKVREVGRDMYDDNKPMRAELEVISGKVAGSKVKDKIDSAKNLKELDNATKDVPRD